MTKHTQGPWKYIQLTQKVIARSVGGCNLEESDHMIADIRGWSHLAYLKDGAEIQDANGLLIAAAPDLLSCLIEMVEVHDEPCHLDHHGCCHSHFLDDVNEGGCRVANARAAIAKATGENK